MYGREYSHFQQGWVSYSDALLLGLRGTDKVSWRGDDWQFLKNHLYVNVPPLRVDLDSEYLFSDGKCEYGLSGFNIACLRLGDGSVRYMFVRSDVKCMNEAVRIFGDDVSLSCVAPALDCDFGLAMKCLDAYRETRSMQENWVEDDTVVVRDCCDELLVHRVIFVDGESEKTKYIGFHVDKVKGASMQIFRLLEQMYFLDRFVYVDGEVKVRYNYEGLDKAGVVDLLSRYPYPESILFMIEE